MQLNGGAGSASVLAGPRLTFLLAVGYTLRVASSKLTQTIRANDAQGNV